MADLLAGPHRRYSYPVRDSELSATENPAAQWGFLRASIPNPILSDYDGGQVASVYVMQRDFNK